MKKIYTLFFRIITCYLFLNCPMKNTSYGQHLTTANGISGIKTLSQIGSYSAVTPDFEFYAIAVFDHIPDKQLLQELQNAKFKLFPGLKKQVILLK